VLKLDYLVKTKREITDRGKRRSGNNLDTVLPKFAYLTDVEIPRNAKLQHQKKLIQKALKNHRIKLNPHKFELKKKEELLVQPNPIVGPRNRRMMESSIFEDTWSKIKIPETSYRKWYQDNREEIRYRRQQNGT